MRFIKPLCILLLTYTFTAGYLFEVPALPILNETIRALYLHVPMWFTMIFLLLLSSFHSSRTLITSVTTFVVVLVLFLFGGPSLSGFSFALLIGIIIGTYSSIFVATPEFY